MASLTASAPGKAVGQDEDVVPLEALRPVGGGQREAGVVAPEVGEAGTSFGDRHAQGMRVRMRGAPAEERRREVGE